MTKHRGIRILPDKTKQLLRKRQQVDYEAEQEQFVDWLLDEGKNPKMEVGYSNSTVEDTLYKTNRFYRYVWTELEERYTLRVTQDQAEEFLLDLAAQDHKQSYKIGFEKALKRLFKWKHHKQGSDSWDIEFSFDSPESRTPEDVLNQNELMLLRESALDYGDIPTYGNLSPEERNQWKVYLAQRLGKPKSEISPEDWENTRSWKIPSLICTSIDAGLRPREVERVKVSWLDLDAGLLRFPNAESDETWDAVLQDESISILEKWMDERERYDEYTYTDLLWLTKHGNPYQTSSLNYIFENLCDLTGIDSGRRGLSWRSLRESVAVYLADKMGVGSVKEQLRIRDSRTVAKYEVSGSKRRTDVIQRMG